jgi:hypothetical protein
MRVLLAVAVAVAAAVATMALLLLQDDGPSAALRLSSTAPLVVEGRGFLPEEAVSVTVSTGPRTYRRAVSATEDGSFRATIREAVIDPCGGVRVSATGTEGSRASAKLPQRLCPP